MRIISLFLPLRIAVILFFIAILFVTAYPYVHIWRKTQKNKNLIGLRWTDETDLQAASAFHQNRVTLLLLILGGCWGVYTWLSQWNDQRAAVQLNISAHQEKPPEEIQGYFIAGDVIFKNAGNRRTTLRFADGPLFVAKITFNKDVSSEGLMVRKGTDSPNADCQASKIQFDKPQRFWLSRPSVDGRPDVEVQDEIRPGEQDEFHFFVRVAGPGTYAIIFSSDLPENEQSDAVPYSNNLGPCASPPSVSFRKRLIPPLFQRDPRTEPRWESAAYFVDVK